VLVVAVVVVVFSRFPCGLVVVVELLDVVVDVVDTAAAVNVAVQLLSAVMATDPVVHSVASGPLQPSNSTSVARTM
jgi:hypothetical protein